MKLNGSGFVFAPPCMEGNTSAVRQHLPTEEKTSTTPNQRFCTRRTVKVVATEITVQQFLNYAGF